MKTITALGTAALLAVSTFATPALAQHGYGHDDDRRSERREHREERRDDRRDWRDERREDRRDHRDDRREARHDRYDDRREAIARHHRWQREHDRRDRHYDARRYYAPRSYRPSYVYVAPRGYRSMRWHVGHRMPPPFYARPYYIDPLAYQLRMPPRGYRWVRVDRDVYLVSVASGLIADVLYGIFR